MKYRAIFFPGAIFLFTFPIYLYFAGRFQFIFPTSIYNYFSFLSEAFLNGSLSFVTDPPYLHDLTTFAGKIYMYWGPAPVLVVLPFVAFFGRHISDALYTSIIGSFNPLILFLILKQLQKLMFIKISNFKIAILCLFFAFGTVHFYLSIFGTVWFTSQIISIFYLLISLMGIIKFSNSKRIIFLIISSVFLGLAINSRNTLIFYIPLFLTFLLLPYIQKKESLQSFLKNFIIFSTLGSFILVLNLFYNYFRFGSFFENGYQMHHFATHFAKDQLQYGFLNSHYLPKNFFYMFLNIPNWTNQFPFFVFNTEGNSIFFTSPILLLIILLIRKKYWQTITSKLINFSIIIGSISTILILLLFWGTGWVQFGNRYSLDIIPLFILILFQVIQDIPFTLIMILIIISIFINYLGTVWFLTI